MGGVLEKIPVKIVELLGRKGLRIVPPDRVLGFTVADNELVGGGTAGMRSGNDGKGPCRRHLSLSTANRLLVQRRNGSIVQQSAAQIGRHDAVIVVDRI